MRIHTDENTWSNIYAAARAARVRVEGRSFKSSIRESGFDIHLTGESRRRPNRRVSSDEFAATWDQWGVFLGHLFNIDPNMVCGTPKRPVYRSEADFEDKTARRFVAGQWPTDTHGDHTFRYSGVPCEQSCTKCSAVQRWSI
jgi:hypothetical protein